MKIVLTTESVYSASRLKERIISVIKGEFEEVQVDTWSFTKSGEGYDIIFHNPRQYVDSPSKNVIFRIETDGENIVFIPSFWKSNPEPTREVYCLHVGRMTELLLSYFVTDVVKYSIIGY